MAPRKRGRGRPRGSVYWHAASERWCAQTPPDRRTRRRSRYFQNENAAWAWLDDQVAALDVGRDIFAGAELIGDYLDRWYEQAADDPERDWSDRTKTNYRWAIARLEELHRTPIEDLARSDVERTIRALARRYGRSSLRVIRTVLHTALEDLVDEEILAKNPARRRRRRQRLEADDQTIAEIAWTEAETRRFLQHARPSPRAPLWWLALSCGLCNGELRAIQLDELDLRGGRLLIQHTADESGKKLTRTKGKRKRTLDLPKNAIDALPSHLKARRAIGGRLLQRDDGRVLRGSDVREELQAIRLAAGVPPIARFHELRHIAASLMFANGYQGTLVSHVLGHQSLVTTLTIYTHFVPKRPFGRPRNISDVLPFDEPKQPPAVRPAVPPRRPPEREAAVDLTLY